LGLLLISTIGAAGEPEPSAGTRKQPSAAEVLQSNGLRRWHSRYVLKAETDVEQKLVEVDSLFRELLPLFEENAAYINDRMALKVLEERRSYLRREIDDLNVALGRFPRRLNSVQRGQYNALRDQRDSDQLQLDDVIRNGDILRNRAPNGQQRRQLDAEIEAKRPAFLEAVRELRQLVEATRAEYARLAKDEVVLRALRQVPQSEGARLTVGTSDGFLAAVRRLRQFEGLFALGTRANASPSASKKSAKSAP
jgi:hypothetical protein